MKKNMSRAELEARFDEIRAREPETLTAQEAVSLAEAEAMDDGTSVSLEDFKRDLEDYSGRLVLRIPRSLHKALKEAAQLSTGTRPQGPRPERECLWRQSKCFASNASRWRSARPAPAAPACAASRPMWPMPRTR